MARGGQSSGGQRQAHWPRPAMTRRAMAPSPFSVWGSAVGWRRVRAGQRQCVRPDLQPGRRRGRRRLSRDAEPRCSVIGASFAYGDAVGRRLHGQGLEQRGQRGGLRQLHAATASMPICWRATPTPTTSCSARSWSPACSRARPTAAPAPTSSSARPRLGYQVAVYAPASATVTPFARLQVIDA